VDTFAEISGWIQLVLLLGMLIMARQMALMFERLDSWRLVWITFAFGFTGMLESGVLVIILAYNYEHWLIRFANRFVTPLQAKVGLFLGMLLLYQIFRRVQRLDGSLFRTSPTALFTLDPEGRILAWDAGAELLFGWPATEAIGASFQERLSPTRRVEWAHVPIVYRQRHAGGQTPYTDRYTLSVVHQRTHEEFSTEVFLTTVPQDDGTLQFNAVAMRLHREI
jgi:PAS domain S-box-containing protein